MFGYVELELTIDICLYENFTSAISQYHAQLSKEAGIALPVIQLMGPAQDMFLKGICKYII